MGRGFHFSQRGEVEELAQILDMIFLIFNTVVVFKVHLGFALLEGGIVRIKNQQTTIFMCTADLCMNTIGWWLLGQSLSFGEHKPGYIVGQPEGLWQHDVPQQKLGNTMFNWALMSISTKIVVGCVAERMSLVGYFMFSLFQSCWIFPTVTHSAWSGGILQDLGYLDHAGGGVVHLLGGVCGLVCILFLGPRQGRFSSDTNQNEFRPNNIPLIILGSLILWFAFYGFIVGANISPVGRDNAQRITLILFNTTISAAFAASFSWLLHLVRIRYFRMTEWRQDEIFCSFTSIPTICNGFISGLVAITAIGSAITPAISIIVGIVSAIVYFAISILMYRMKLDDPLDAVGSHAGGGIVGLVTLGIAMNCLSTQLLGIAIIIIWVAGNATLFLLLLNRFGLLKEQQSVQQEGQDTYYFGGSCQNLDFSQPFMKFVSERIQNATTQQLLIDERSHAVVEDVSVDRPDRQQSQIE